MARRTGGASNESVDDAYSTSPPPPSTSPHNPLQHLYLSIPLTLSLHSSNHPFYYRDLTSLSLHFLSYLSTPLPTASTLSPPASSLHLFHFSPHLFITTTSILILLFLLQISFISSIPYFINVSDTSSFRPFTVYHMLFILTLFPPSFHLSSSEAFNLLPFILFSHSVIHSSPFSSFLSSSSLPFIGYLFSLSPLILFIRLILYSPFAFL